MWYELIARILKLFEALLDIMFEFRT